MLPRDFCKTDWLTDDERSFINRWSMWGHDICAKVGRHWDSSVPGAPLFKTRSEAYDFASTFVCESLKRRALERYERAKAESRKD